MLSMESLHNKEVYFLFSVCSFEKGAMPFPKGGLVEVRGGSSELDPPQLRILY